MDDFDMNQSQFEIFKDFIKLKNNIDQLILPIRQKYKLTPLGVVILYIIQGNRNITIGKIQRMLQVNQGNLSSTCKKLESQGFLSRNRSKRDERVVTLSITPSGEDILNTISKDFKVLKSELKGIPIDKLQSAKQGLKDMVFLFTTLNEAANMQEEN